MRHLDVKKLPSRTELQVELRVTLLALIARVPIAAMPAGGAPVRRELVVMAERDCMAVILIVEDDVFIRDYAELMIQDWGHATLLAGDIDEALTQLRSPRHIDALFTDICLKKAVLGGYEVAHQAIALRPELRVIYVTGNSITEKMTALFVEGARFLQKPYSQLQLQNAVAELLTV
jgi:CheY-like chemotaxis protein